jgi:hypothetical protein
VTAPRRISARDTFFAKFAIPPFFLVGSVLIVSLSVWGLDHPESLVERLFRLVCDLVAIGVAAPVAWAAFRLKQVGLDDASLYVSNYAREVVVPLGEVEGVDQITGLSAGVIVRFARDIGFGRRIVFSPPGLTHPNPHPVVTELRAAVAAARGQ